MNRTDTYILFELAGSAYGVRSEDVQHVDVLEHITPVPNTAAAVDGLVFSRGQVVPALNLRVRFGLPRVAPTPATRLLFMRVQQRLVALVVDSAREFVRIPGDAVRPIEDTLHGVDGNYVLGVATVKHRMVLLLDVAAVLCVDELSGDSTPAAAMSVQPTA